MLLEYYAHVKVKQKKLREGLYFGAGNSARVICFNLFSPDTAMATYLVILFHSCS